MPHGNPNKPWGGAQLTQEQIEFVERAYARYGGTKADMVREALLDLAASVLSEPAPGRKRRVVDYASAREPQLNPAELLVRDPDGFRDWVRAEAKKAVLQKDDSEP